LGSWTKGHLWQENCVQRCENIFGTVHYLANAGQFSGLPEPDQTKGHFSPDLWRLKNGKNRQPKVKIAPVTSQNRHKNVTDAKMGQRKLANPLNLLARGTGFEPVTSSSGG
jgi:hypothetical protein